MFTRNNSIDDLYSLVARANIIIHLAGENRPTKEEDFFIGNTKLTASLCDAVRKSGKLPNIFFASSIQAELNNLYGKSKLKAEEHLIQLQEDVGLFWQFIDFRMCLANGLNRIITRGVNFLL